MCITALSMLDTSTVVDFSQFTPEVGYKITASSGFLGLNTKGNGDFNGDGTKDILIQAQTKVYLVSGRKSPSTSISVDSMTSSEGVIISASSTTLNFPSIDFIGDLNGDGKDEIIIGCPGSNVVFVVFGRSAPYTSIDLDNLGSSGYKITGENSLDLFGSHVAGIRDVNGDNKPDMLIGATGSNSGKGSAYVVFGQPSTSPTINLASFPSSSGFKISSSSSLSMGITGRSVGRFNSDNLYDFIVCEQTACHVIFGTASTPANVDPSTFPSSSGFSIPHTVTTSLDTFGFLKSVTLLDCISYADINNDKHDDIIIGAPQDSLIGAVYVIFGHNSLPTNYNLQNRNANQMIKISGDISNGFFGIGVAGVGDCNGDGVDDIIIGQTGFDSYKGAYYVIYGNTAITDISISNLQPSQGYRNQGAVQGALGATVSSLDDVNQDGLQDFSVSTSMGLIYIVYGIKTDGPVNVIKSYQKSNIQCHNVDKISLYRFGRCVNYDSYSSYQFVRSV